MVSTRASNSSKNPGLIDAPRPRRRTSAVNAIKAEKTAKEVAKAAEQAEKNNTVQELEAQLIADQALQRTQRTTIHAPPSAPLRRHETTLLGGENILKKVGKRKELSPSPERELADTSSLTEVVSEAPSPDPDDPGYETTTTITVSDDSDTPPRPAAKKARLSKVASQPSMVVDVSKARTQSHVHPGAAQPSQPPTLGPTIAELRKRNDVPHAIHQWIGLCTDTGLYTDEQPLPAHFVTAFPHLFRPPVSSASGVPANPRSSTIPRIPSFYPTTQLAFHPPVQPRTLAVPATPYTGAPKPQPKPKPKSKPTNSQHLGNTSQSLQPSSKAKGKMVDSGHSGVKTSGYVDSDDEIQESQAARASPPKHGARLTNEALVKCKEEDDFSASKANKHSFATRPRITGKTSMSGPGSSTGQNDGSSKGKAIDVEDEPSCGKSRGTTKNSDLPKGARDGNRWRGQFIPTLLQFLGTSLDPWDLPDTFIVPTLQKIWDVVYGDTLPWTVTVNDCVHAIAMQRIYEWRGYFGSSALRAFNHFFQISPHDFPNFDTCAWFCKDIVKEGKLFYETSENGQNKGLYRSAFVLSALSEHLEAIRGAVHVPSLYNTGSRKYPYGAIGLSAAAAYRAAILFSLKKVGHDETGRLVVLKTIRQSTGKASPKDTAFSGDNYGMKTRQCTTSAYRLQPTKLDTILDYAAQTILEGTDTASTSFNVRDVEFDFTNLVENE